MFLDFNNRFFLFFLPLIFAPILIHLLFRKKIVVFFSGNEILKSLLTQKRFIKRWQRYLLLFLRVLIFLFIILSFSEPVLFLYPGSGGSKQSASVVFLFDVSCSMNYSSAGETELERNKYYAAKIVERLPSNVNAAVVSYSNIIEKSAVNFTTDRNALLNYIEAVGPTNKPTLHLSGLNYSADILNKQLSNSKTILWFTDAASHGFLGQKTDLTGINIVALTNKTGGRPNVFFTKLNTQDQFINAELQSDDFAGELQIKVFEYDRNIFQTISKIRTGSNSLPLAAAFSDGKNYRAEIFGDSLTQDNRFYFSTPKKPYLKTLIIDGNPQPGYRSEIYYLTAAIKSLDIKYDTANPAELAGLDLKNYDSLIFSNYLPAENEGAFNRSIEYFLKRNGKVIIFLGDNVETLPRWMFGKLGDKFFRRINPKPTNKIENISKGLLTLEYGWDISGWEYRQIEAPEELTLMKDDNGIPFLISDGQINLFNTTANKKWSDLASKPVFPILLEKLLVEQNIFGDIMGFVGEAVPLNIPIGAKLTVKIEGKTETLSSNSKLIVEKAGVYETVWLSDGKRTESNLIINPHPNESVLTRESNLAKHLKNANTTELEPENTDKILAYLSGKSMIGFSLVALSLLFMTENLMIFLMLKE